MTASQSAFAPGTAPRFFGLSNTHKDTGWVELVLHTYGYSDGNSLRHELVADLYAILHGAEVRQGNITKDEVLAQFPRIVALMKKKMGIK